MRRTIINVVKVTTCKLTIISNELIVKSQLVQKYPQLRKISKSTKNEEHYLGGIGK